MLTPPTTQSRRITSRIRVSDKERFIIFDAFLKLLIRTLDNVKGCDEEKKTGHTERGNKLVMEMFRNLKTYPC